MATYPWFSSWGLRVLVSGIKTLRQSYENSDDFDRAREDIAGEDIITKYYNNDDDIYIITNNGVINI